MLLTKRIHTLRTPSDASPPATGNFSYFPVITASGFAAALAQIVLLRELMVLCYGIELCMGVILAAWLTGSALGCRVSARAVALRSLKPAGPGLLLILAALLLPLTLIFARAAGPLLGIVPGELPPLIRLLIICIATTLPFSFLSGALFGLCWGMFRTGGGIPMSIYIGESLGSALGGLLFYLLIIAHQSSLTIVLLASLALLLTAALFFMGGHHPGIRLRAFSLIGLLILMMTASLFFEGDLDLASRRTYWGPDLVASEDTPYQNLSMLHRDGQYSVFTSGLWLYSVPDQATREYAVHPALLQHPAPASVLLLGGAMAGLPEEILRHPSVRQLDIVELDPALTDFSAAHLPETYDISEAGSNVTLHYADAAEYIRTGDRRYDVVLMNVGDPVNAQMNRFYTASFFSAVKHRMAPNGIFSFGVSGGEEVLGEVQIEFLGAIRRTLAQTFPHVSVLPGDTVRFFAAAAGGRLTDDPGLLVDRIRQRDLHLSYVREDTLQDRFESFRLRYFTSVLDEAPSTDINRDFTPLCYAHTLRLWTAQWHSRLAEAMAFLTRLRPKSAWVLLILACGLLIAVFSIGRSRPESTVYLSVATVGGLTIGVQMVLLIVFQIMEGALFLHLALIVALFMAGLACGAGSATSILKGGSEVRQPAKLLILAQAALCLFPVGLAGLFLLIHGPLQPGPESRLAVFLFPGLSLLSGFLGGLHFSAASATIAGLGQPVSGIGGRLYAFDLLGSAGGLILATFLLIPTLGPIQVLPMFSLVASAGLPVLLRRL